MATENRPSATNAEPATSTSAGGLNVRSIVAHRPEITSRMDRQIHDNVAAILRHLASIEMLLKPRCDRCSRPLSDPESIARGLGHVCAKTVAR